MENEVRGFLRNLGYDLGKVTARDFERRVRELAGDTDLVVVEPLLVVRRTLRDGFAQLDDLLVRLAREDAVCRRFMTVPGVGPLFTHLPRHGRCAGSLARSRAVGAHFGLTPRKHQSGEVNRIGQISKWGDAMMRTALYEAAQVLLTRVKRWSALKAWAAQVSRRRGHKKAIVALARRIGVILHRIWVDGTDFHWGTPPVRLRLMSFGQALP